MLMVAASWGGGRPPPPPLARANRVRDPPRVRRRRGAGPGERGGRPSAVKVEPTPDRPRQGTDRGSRGPPGRGARRGRRNGSAVGARPPSLRRRIRRWGRDLLRLRWARSRSRSTRRRAARRRSTQRSRIARIHRGRSLHRWNTWRRDTRGGRASRWAPALALVPTRTAARLVRKTLGAILHRSGRDVLRRSGCFGRTAQRGCFRRFWKKAAEVAEARAGTSRGRFRHSRQWSGSATRGRRLAFGGGFPRRRRCQGATEGTTWRRSWQRRTERCCRGLRSCRRLLRGLQSSGD